MKYDFVRGASRRWLRVALGTALAASAAADEGRAGEASPARGDRELAQEDRIRELERQLQVVIEELADVRTQVVVPEEPELKSLYGFGPAASKIYGASRGLSIGGYGEAFYRNFVGESSDAIDAADALRLVTYFGYKFSEALVFHSEIEFEHASTSKAGEVSVEFVALDFFWNEWLNARAGLLLVPMGFVNELHEPPFFYGVNRPEVERQIIPSTWRENGVGVFGRGFGEELRYRAYVVNGFDATGYSASGLRGGRQKGSRAKADQLAFVGRLDWRPRAELLLSGSIYSGDAGQNQEIDTVAFGSVEIPDARTTLLEAHGEYRSGGLSMRGLYTRAFVDDADTLTLALRDAGEIGASEVIAEEMVGAYFEVAYDVYPWLWSHSERALEPFLRVEYLDTQDEVPSGFSRDRTLGEMIYTIGASFRPHANVVLKVDYRTRDRERGDDEEAINLGLGFAF